MDQIAVPYMTASGRLENVRFDISTTRIDLDLMDIAAVDLSAFVWRPKLEYLNLRGNAIQTIDLYHVRKCTSLLALRLNHNRLQNVDLSPMSHCINLREITINDNQLKTLDVSPLFFFPSLVELDVDDDVILKADSHLKEKANWSDVLVDIFNRIQWLG